LVHPLPIWREDERRRVHTGRCGKFARGESFPKFASGRGGIAMKIVREDFTETVGNTLLLGFFIFYR
jgi:hypothetical protein